MELTNVERLAHIQDQIDDARAHGGMYSSTHVELEWLIEQAKLNAEREDGFWGRLSARFMTKNRRLSEALEFYANTKTYELGVNISMGSAFPQHEPIKRDKGSKAREALEGNEDIDNQL